MKYYALLVLLFAPLSLLGQEEDTTAYKPRIVGLPIVFYSPETRFAFGAAGFFTFKFDKQDSLLRPSDVNLGGAYTLENQLLSYADYDFWLHENNYNFTGELGYYRYFYDFWGVGTEPKQIERYSLTFPRIRFEGVRQIAPGFYGGLKYTFDAFDITEKEAGGRLIQDAYPGTQGGKISGLGAIIKYDTRDHIFYPTSGYKVQASYERFDPAIGSDFQYHLTWIDAVRYFDLKKERVIAANVYGRFARGNVPFFHLSMVGGNSRMRGYYEGYHRDKQMLGWQVEYRMPVWWRLGFVAFAGNAVVSESLAALQLKNTSTAVGGGIRFRIDRERKINVRLDYAYTSDQTTGFYFTISEAF
ncbi:MAG: BamA/TamA family outer membrane protein [Bacteroidota bacterium]